MIAGIFLANGFEESEGLIVVDMFRRAGVQIDMISMNDTTTVTTSHQIQLQADMTFQQCSTENYDILILPGGKVGTSNLEACEVLKQCIQKHYDSGKLTCAICAAPSILGHMGLLKNRQYTCFPTFDGEYGGSYQMELAVKDGNVITGRGMGATIEFAHTILANVIDDSTMQQLEYGMQYDKTFRTLNKPE